MASAANFKTSNEISGKRDDTLPWAMLADKYRSDDMAVITKEEDIFTLEPFFYKNRTLIMRTHKTPLYDMRENIIGLAGFAQVVCSISNTMNGCLSQTELKDIPIHKDNLKKYFYGITLREAQILYHLSRGDSSKAIAQKLNLSHRTIEQYCDQLKSKFNCHSKSELVKKAFDSGFIHFLPCE